MKVLTGIAVSPGVAIAEAFVVDAEELRIPRRNVSAREAKREEEKLDDAIEQSVTELTKQRQEIADRMGQDVADVFNWHIGVLKDERFRREVRELITKKHYSAAYATSTVMRNTQRRFLQMTDPLLSERIRDVQDIERRLLRNILGAAGEDLAHLSEEIILIAHDLTTSQAARLSATRIAGVALDAGGSTSHTAILLRSWGRPAVVGLSNVAEQVSSGDTVIVDAVNHLLIVAPDAETLEEYRTRQAGFRKLSNELGALRDQPAETQDGQRIKLMANIEYPREVEVSLQKGAEGIGLYRTEYLFLRDHQPDEEEQTQAYLIAIQAAGDRLVTFRTFDLGADKITQERNVEPERNPMLGNRSLRYSLQHLDMFKTQLRAILRAAVGAKVRLMFPLVTGLTELRQAKMTLRDAMEDLEEAGVPFQSEIEVGMMLETPAAVYQCRDFVKEVAFISIGTNDLIQYLLAADRGNAQVSRYYSASHPAVIRTIRDTIRTCTRARVDCTLCGEMAGEPIYTLLLIGLGLRTLSMAPNNIPEVKKLIRASTLLRAERLARRALTFETDTQVTNYLRSETKKILPEDPI